MCLCYNPFKERKYDVGLVRRERGARIPHPIAYKQVATEEERGNTNAGFILKQHM